MSAVLLMCVVCIVTHVLLVGADIDVAYNAATHDTNSVPAVCMQCHPELKLHMHFLALPCRYCLHRVV